MGIDRSDRLPFPPSDGLVLSSNNLKPIWTPPSTVFVQVETFADLPDASLHPSDIYWVKTSTGLWLFNRKSRGFYRSNGIVWEYGGELVESFNSDVFRVYDATTNSKAVGFDVSAVANSTQRTISVPDRDINLDTIQQATIIYNLECHSSVAVGSIVRFSGSTLINALADSISNAKIDGIIIDKPTSTTGHLMVTGLSPDIFFGLVPGTNYYLSADSNGSYDTALPTGFGRVIVRIGKAVSETKILINPAIIAIRG